MQELDPHKYPENINHIHGLSRLVEHATELPWAFWMKIKKGQEWMMRLTADAWGEFGYFGLRERLKDHGLIGVRINPWGFRYTQRDGSRFPVVFLPLIPLTPFPGQSRLWQANPAWKAACFEMVVIQFTTGDVHWMEFERCATTKD